MRGDVILVGEEHRRAAKLIIDPLVDTIRSTDRRFTLTVAGGFGDAFVAKLDSSGDWEWVAGIGSTDYEEGRGVAVDQSGNSYFTGYFSGTVDVDPGPGVSQRGCAVKDEQAVGGIGIKAKVSQAEKLAATARWLTRQTGLPTLSFLPARSSPSIRLS